MCVQSIVSLFVWISVSVSGSVNKPLLGKQECIPVGCVLRTSVPVLGDVCPGGVSLRDGLPQEEGCLPRAGRGVYA